MARRRRRTVRRTSRRQKVTRKAVPWRPAKALTKLQEQVNAEYPNRSRGYDGMIGDASHRARKSDHNPNDAGAVLAFDITHDPRHGFDCNVIADRMRLNKDVRLRYLIFNKRIFGNAGFVEDNGGKAWEWGRYSRAKTMPHDHHMHVSLVRVAKLYDDETAWDLGAVNTKDPVATEIVERPLLKRGSKDTEAIKELQGLLGIEPDGKFGPGTKKAVREFQQSRGLEADGHVGNYTWEALVDKHPVMTAQEMVAADVEIGRGKCRATTDHSTHTRLAQDL